MSSLSVPTQLFNTCELCALFMGKNEMMRPFCTNKCVYCNKNVCAQCSASAAELPFIIKLYDSSKSLNSICFQCIIADRHKIITKAIYKVIGNYININIINVIALFAIQECNECNNVYPKSWSIIQPDMLTKLIHYAPPKCTHIKSLLSDDNCSYNKYKQKYCKECNIEQERDIICNAIYNILKYTESYSGSYSGSYSDNIDFALFQIIDIITLYSIGRIFSCSNFNNCHSNIIINNNFDGLIQRKDINGMNITRSNTLDRVFCHQCTIDENRCDRIQEKCSFCYRCTLFGHNKTCNGCLKRFCHECLQNENNECYLEKKYYFTTDGNLKYYQYCMECTYWIYDDIDILDHEISFLNSCDFYQELINDYDYTQYKSVDQCYRFTIITV